eukprot:8760303-Pyramimonas_sp.AAC.1
MGPQPGGPPEGGAPVHARARMYGQEAGPRSTWKGGGAQTPSAWRAGAALEAPQVDKRAPRPAV